MRALNRPILHRGRLVTERLVVTERLDRPLALGICLLAVWLHLEVFRHAGPLWRDEVGGLQLATLPKVGDVWRWLTHDSFPLLYPLLLRGWAALGLAQSDTELRILGFLMGCLGLGAVWLCAYCLGLRAPVLALGLFAVNLAVIRWGDSLRAYGCGTLLIVLTFGLVWRQVQGPALGRWGLASLAALLSVQCLYANAFLVLAICLAGAAVCTVRRQMRSALFVLALGVPGALSLVPYAGAIAEAQDHYVLQKVTVNAATLGEALVPVLGYPEWLMPWLWLGLLGFVIIAAVKSLMPTRACPQGEQDDLALFGGLTLLAGCLSFFGYLKVSQLVKVWHFLPLLALGALCLEAGWKVHFPRLRGVVWAVVVGLVITGFPHSLRSARVGMTGIEAVAHALERRADGADLVVVYPWYFGISFGRYFHGPASWVTLPEIEDLRFHRYDLVKAKITASAPLRPVLDRIERTLRAGHRVWFVGNPPAAGTGEPDPESLPPGPLPGVANGWWEAYHTHRWGRQAARFFNRHAAQLEAVPIVFTPPVLDLEAPPVYVASGWRDTQE